jgi:RNA ligase
VLLAAYDEGGRELSYDEILAVADAIGWRAAHRHTFESMPALMKHTAGLPLDTEGYVVRFSNGLRLRLKGAEYCRVYALISRCTPLAIWDIFANGGDPETMRRELPEGFCSDFDDIGRVLRAQAGAIEAHLSDKELGLSLGTIPPDVRPFVCSGSANPAASTGGCGRR